MQALLPHFSIPPFLPTAIAEPAAKIWQAAQNAGATASSRIGAGFGKIKKIPDLPVFAGLIAANSVQDWIFMRKDHIPLSWEAPAPDSLEGLFLRSGGNINEGYLLAFQAYLVLTFVQSQTQISFSRSRNVAAAALLGGAGIAFAELGGIGNVPDFYDVPAGLIGAAFFASIKSLFPRAPEMSLFPAFILGIPLAIDAGFAEMIAAMFYLTR